MLWWKEAKKGTFYSVKYDEEDAELMERVFKKLKSQTRQKADRAENCKSAVNYLLSLNSKLTTDQMILVRAMVHYLMGQ